MILSIIVVFFFAEFIERIRLNFIGNHAMEQNIYLRKIGARIYKFWLDLDQKDIFIPPYKVFSNENIQSVDRIKFVNSFTKIAPGDYESFDFLQDPLNKELTKYKIHINKYGFRGPEFNLDKDQKIRIISIGSYQTFGHGVNDHETYSAQLQESLNSLSWKRKYEVLNRGRHSGTAIVGSSFVIAESEKYCPDIFIVDYGMVDPLVWSDDFFPVAMRFPDHGLNSIFKKGLLYSMPFFEKSIFLNKLFQQISVQDKQKKLIQNFNNSIFEIIKFAELNKIKVILVKQQVAKRISNNVYEKFENENVKFIDVKKIFANKIKSMGSDYQNLNNPNWTSELPKYETNQYAENEYTKFKLDYFQLNALGHKILSDEIANKIQEFNLKKSRYCIQKYEY